MKGLIKCRKRTIRKQGERKVEKVRRVGHLVFQKNAKGGEKCQMKTPLSSRRVHPATGGESGSPSFV